jgi:D-alanyl-D-alanine carboxypeptidase/D-alanyl-D-alanine-endopeptidase (penicillin-binding protein 4)
MRSSIRHRRLAVNALACAIAALLLAQGCAALETEGESVVVTTAESVTDAAAPVGTEPQATPAAETPSRPSPRFEALGWTVDSFLAKPHLAGTRVAILVESLETGDVLFERNADVPMVPASNMKVVTGVAALSLLGPDHRFTTTVSTDGSLRGSSLAGDLYVSGTGDPSFVSEEMWKLVEELRLHGVERVDGDIVLDVSYFDEASTTSPTVANGQRAYHARTGALSLNFNSVAVHVFPGLESGDPARVEVSPKTDFVRIRNRATTGSARQSLTLKVERTFEDGRNILSVSGRIPAGALRRVFYRNLEDPAVHFGTAMAEFMATAGIEHAGAVRLGSRPADAAVLLVHRSKPLSLVIRDLNKFSNNFVAEQLVKILAAEVLGPPGTTAGGRRVLEDFLAAAGADSGTYRVVDGSGFSTENRLSPRSIARAVRHALSDFEISYEYAASLSVSGTDGTLEDRMGYPGLEGAVRAKTGLLDSVTAIAGILRTLAGEDLLFSIITNGYDCEAWKVHDMEHAILTTLSGVPKGEEQP